ncbi:MAG: hypothetical protein RIQ56_47 [Candidatus Parcubacteria bacterium]|jgi:phosphoribosylformylglycinamidine synthase
MSKPRVIVFSGYGLNCEEETKFAFESAGAQAEIVHINDVIAWPSVLKNAQIVAVGGGFAYGDDTGSGKAYGNRLKNHLGDAIEKFLGRDTLMIGICNGFQVITQAGYLPGTLMTNDGGRYLCRWVDLKVSGRSPWLEGIEKLSVPIAHGEGKYYAPEDMLREMKMNDGIALSYMQGEMSNFLDLPANPNGALEDIAGVTARNGKILGLMPHPERALRFTQLPNWTNLREEYVRLGKEIPEEGPGLQIFKNGVRYFS